MKEQKPIVVNFHENEWEFVFPPSIDNEQTYNQYWEGVELLDYDNREAEQIFKTVIKKHPYHIDAYNHLSLAFKNEKKTFESFLTAEKAYLIGKSCLPKGFKQSKHKLHWSNLDNRPFLRSCHILGMEYQGRKQYKEAIQLYSEILDYNEDDHQGVRYLLLKCFFALKDYKVATLFLKKYKNDWGIEFVYGRLLLAIIANEKEQLESLLADATRRNKFVPEEIAKSKHIVPPPFRIPGEPYFDAGIPVDSIREASKYWKNNKSLLTDKRVKAFFAGIKSNNE